MQMTETDGQLLRRLALGDDTAFECLFMRHHAPVYRVVYGLVDRRDLAEDMTQETFLELYRHPPAFAERYHADCMALPGGPEQKSKLAAWRAPRPGAGGQLLRNRQVPTTTQALLLKSEEQARVRDALAQLTERQRTILLLRHAGLSYAEVAVLAEIAPGSVGTMLLRAEQAFVQTYKKSGGDVDARPLGGAKQ